MSSSAAAAWTARQVAPDTIVACDPQMGAVLQSKGIPASRLLVLGGGNAKQIKEPPAGARLSNNLTAFRGGFRLWHLDDVRTLSSEEAPPRAAPTLTEWRVI